MPGRMKRTQIYLDIEVDQRLGQLAARRGVSKAQLIRDCARRVVEEERVEREPLLDIVGMLTGGPEDVSEEHDRYLAEQETSGWDR